MQTTDFLSSAAVQVRATLPALTVGFAVKAAAKEIVKLVAVSPSYSILAVLAWEVARAGGHSPV